jgi:Tat protein translocase TatB subunit
MKQIEAKIPPIIKPLVVQKYLPLTICTSRYIFIDTCCRAKMIPMKGKVMFGIGMPELIVIAIVALLVVGPKKLPDLAKSLGRGLSEFRRASESVTESFKETLKEDDVKPEADERKNSLLYGKEGEKSPPQENAPTKPQS